MNPEYVRVMRLGPVWKLFSLVSHTWLLIKKTPVLFYTDKASGCLNKDFVVKLTLGVHRCKCLEAHTNPMPRLIILFIYRHEGHCLLFVFYYSSKRHFPYNLYALRSFTSYRFCHV